MQFDTLIRGGRVCTAEQGVFEADLALSDGKVAAILRPGERVAAEVVVDASDQIVLPGAIDPHLHFCLVKEPEDDYDTETASAAVGGVTTVMPYLVTGGDYDTLFRRTLEGAERVAHTDFAFHYFLGSDEHIASVGHFIRDHGVPSFKFFMPGKQGEESIFGDVAVDDGVMYDLFSELARHEEALACVHCENIEVVRRFQKRAMESGMDGLAAWAATRPPFVEAEAVNRAVFFAGETGCRVHVVHLSSSAGLEQIRVARARHPDVRLTVETCPSYLVMNVDSSVGNLARVVPPVQTARDNEALWQGIAEGTIDCMATDHSPGLAGWKEGTIWQARNNFTDVAVLLPILLSEGHHKRGIPLQRIVEVCSFNTARIFGLFPRKGTIRVGSDADLAIVDLNWERVVRNDELYTWADFSIYEGMALRGWPRQTFVRGTLVQQDGKLVGRGGHGRYVRRPVGDRDERARVAGGAS